MERWKPGSMQWMGAPSMYIHRSNFGVAVLDDMIFVIGGFNGITTIYNVECYDPDNDEWYDACDMNVYRSALSIGVVSDLPNVREFTWPRDRDLPPPAFSPTCLTRAGRHGHGGKQRDQRRTRARRRGG
nr:kelch-like protein 10 [Lytechinus pictus]